MSVRSTLVFVPAPQPMATIASASSREASSVGMKAPLPTLTSITSVSRPQASFLPRIEATISGIDSTVAVTSRTP